MSQGLVVVQPVLITDAMLISSTVPEADYAAWSGVTTYALAARAIVTTGVHKIYESVQAANLNHAVTDTAWWVAVSPTNRWKCFDTSNSTQTAQATSQYVLKPWLALSHIALLNITDCTSIRVRLVSDASGPVYDKTIYLSKIISESSWYAFFIGAKKTLYAAIFDDIPYTLDATITIDIVGAATAAFGVLLLGQGTELGIGVTYGARVSIQDYSRKETNAFGDTVLVKRAYAKRASFGVLINNDALDMTIDILATLRATPCLYIGSGLYSSTMVFGIYETFENVISYPTRSDCAINLLGLS